MRKEIIGILLFFLVIFTLLSLLSYSPADPSINHARTSNDIHNIFGVFGAHTAGILVLCFGLGAFWVPVLLLLAGVYLFGERPSRAYIPIAVGGLLLVITTGSLLAFHQHHYTLFGSRFSAGGIIGIALKGFLVRYTNVSGGVIILFLTWMIAFILTTGFSLIAFSKACGKAALVLADRLKTYGLKWKERRAKARKRTRQKKRQPPKRALQIKVQSRPQPAKPKPKPQQEVFEFMRSDADFKMPSIKLLDEHPPSMTAADDHNLRMQSKLLEKKLEDFGVRGQVVAVTPGPVITTFEYEPAPGVKINKIVNLTDDLALALRATSIRIVAPIPGKAVIGVEIPNADRETVHFREIVSSEVFEKSKSNLTLCLGKDIVGNPVVTELEKMPHLLIAGATGSGKSVALNTMICGILYKANPAEVKLILVDPKKIELSMYDGIPHLITPVVSSAKKATNALYWAVREMERRYELLSHVKARHIKQYNQKITKGIKGEDGEPLKSCPYVVVVIDELADLMMVASRDVEVALTRLAQMARAAGIHLILATQRPSVDVLTGIIKANFPTRLSFQVSSKTDSRTIIDSNGAENLLGNGDMLFLPPGAGKLQRIHGAYMSETEIIRITDHLKRQSTPEYNQEVVEKPTDNVEGDTEEDYDEKYDDAVALITRTRQASISMIQRHLRIGYNRAARIIETMEREGLVGPADGSKPREVLVRGYDDDV